MFVLLRGAKYPLHHCHETGRLGQIWLPPSWREHTSDRMARANTSVGNICPPNFDECICTDLNEEKIARAAMQQSKIWFAREGLKWVWNESRTKLHTTFCIPRNSTKILKKQEPERFRVEETYLIDEGVLVRTWKKSVDLPYIASVPSSAGT